MKSYLSLAWKELKAQRVTAILILIAVILSSLMTTVIGQSIGILQAMRVQQAERLNGSRYATFHQLTQQQAQVLHDDPRLTDVGDVLYLGSMGLGSSLKLSLREYHDDALAMYPSIGKIKEGRLPEAAEEVALPEDALQYLDKNAAVDDTIRLTLTVSTMDGLLPEVEYTADFTLTGILESSYLGYSSGTVQGIVGKGSAEVLLPAAYRLISTDFKTQSKQDFQRIVRELAETLQVDAAFIQYNPVLLNALGIAYDADEGGDTDSGFPFMAAACVIVGVLVLLAAGLVIYNILKISIAKRVQEYGTLRAIGAQHGQVYRLVSVQLLLLCGIGIPVGLLLGVLSAKGVLIAATGALNPDIFMANSAQELNSAISSAAEVKPVMLLGQHCRNAGVRNAGRVPGGAVRRPRFAHRRHVRADGKNQTPYQKVPYHPSFRGMVRPAQPETWVRQNGHYHPVIGDEHHGICRPAKLHRSSGCQQRSTGHVHWRLCAD